MLHIDHAILMTRDLEGCAERLVAEHDLGSVVGGEHPAWGTANRIVPAGTSYLEVMGIGDEARAGDNPLGRFVLDRTAAGDALSLVCLRADDLDAVCERLGLAAEERSRVTPDGTTVRWRMAGLEEALAEGLPFFIAWDGPTGADVADPATGRRASAITRVALGGDPERLGAYVGEHVGGLDLVGGEPYVRSVTLRVGDGDVTV